MGEDQRREQAPELFEEVHSGRPYWFGRREGDRVRVGERVIELTTTGGDVTLPLELVRGLQLDDKELCVRYEAGPTKEERVLHLGVGVPQAYLVAADISRRLAALAP